MRRVLLLAAVASLLVADATPAHADASVAAVGWWTRSPATTAPEGGFAVGKAPDGPTSVAAILLDLGDTGVTAAVLEAVEVGGLGQPLAALQVCPTSTSWAAAAGQPMEQAPAASCEGGAVPATRDEASSTWKADLGTLVGGQTGTIGVMVVPGGDAPLYEVRFARPTLQAASAPPATPDLPVPVPADDVFGETAAAGPQEAGTTGTDVGPLPFDVPGTPGDVGAVPAPELPVPEPAPPADAAPPVESALPPLAPPGGTGPRRTPGQALSFVLVAAAAGTVAGLGRRVGRAVGSGGPAAPAGPASSG